jgi:hypothetical protein
MHFQFEVTTPGVAQTVTPSAAPPSNEQTDLLRQLLDVQREQLQLQKAAHDASGRWKAFLARWQADFPDLPNACKTVLPQLERAYITLIAELTDALKQPDGDGIDNDFALSEFLDKFGIRLGQLGGLLNLVGPLAELAAVEEKK